MNSLAPSWNHPMSGEVILFLRHHADDHCTGQELMCGAKAPQWTEKAVDTPLVSGQNQMVKTYRNYITILWKPSGIPVKSVIPPWYTENCYWTREFEAYPAVNDRIWSSTWSSAGVPTRYSPWQCGTSRQTAFSCYFRLSPREVPSY